MNESLISVRYATALFSLAKEKDLLLSLKDDMELILHVCKISSEFNRMITSPIVKPSGKIKVIRKIFSNKIDRLSMNFLELTVRNGREKFIEPVCRDVLGFIRKEKNIRTAVITTAQTMDENLLQKAEKVLEEELNGRVELLAKVDPRLIGGLILRIDDKQIDSTVSTQLKRLKQELLKTNL
jgi:F-type H+-transporting ATPase subunit delta